MVVKLKRKYVKIYMKGSDMVKKIAVFTDIHGNYEALKSIVGDIKKDNFDEVICLGDLTGIGPSTALKIIKYREENGKFKTIEEIKNVAGIGDSKFEAIKDEICV